MLVVETIAKIRRGYFVQGKAIKAISRELKVSRKVVRKVIRSGETAFVYERTVQPQPKLGPWREELERLLATTAARPNRERLTLVRLFEELRGLGYCGGHAADRHHVRAVLQPGPDAQPAGNRARAGVDRFSGFPDRPPRCRTPATRVPAARSRSAPGAW
jgi:hypothetical protein